MRTTINFENNVKPFLKWAGGKRWFVNSHSSLIPKSYNLYIEPFLGSGAVFFHVSPSTAILGDSNSDLINTYEAIKKDWKTVVSILEIHQKKHNKDYYYKIRKEIPKAIVAQAARFIYLNRTCWNGLYRVNKKGLFNVPIGTRDSIIRNDDCFEQIAQRLSKAELVSCDFEKLINRSKFGDLLYVDPPYTVRHNHNAFIKYNEKLFSWDDQIRLAKALIRAKKRGVKIVCTNAYHKSVIEIYQKDFQKISVSRNSSISSKVDSRKNFEELVIYTEGENIG